MKTPNNICIQWNCRSISQNVQALRYQVDQYKPLIILLQETRGPVSIHNYQTFTHPTITHVSGRGTDLVPLQKGQAAVLVHKSCTAILMDTTQASNHYREIVAVKLALPGKGKQHSLVVASVYYRPRSGTTSPNEYAWIPKLLHEANGTQIIIGGDFNAKHGIWGYATADSRGRILADELESLPLHICNTIGVHTRAGLHAKQADTTPDLTIATPKVVKRWETHPTTWGSDHYPIIFTINKKIRKQRELIRTINWSHFREGVGDKFESIEEFAQLMRDNLSSATEETLGEEDEGVIDSRMIALWKKANKLTQKYKTNGRRYQTLRRIRGIFELIRQHGEDLSRAQWVSTCERLGKINGMKQLWGILRKMLGKGRGQSPLETLTLRHGTDKHEEEIIKTFFPHASTTPPTPLETPKLDSTNPDLDTPFTLGELHAAIKQGRSDSAPGHDGITWKMLRNLSEETEMALLEVINKQWSEGIVPDHMRLSIINPIPKPGKDSTKIANLRPISLTPTICKLTERMIHTRITHYIEYRKPGLHPSQAGFRPNMGTHSNLWLLRRVLNRNSRSGPPDYILAVDMRKAFDNVKQDQILSNLARIYPSQRTIDWIARFLEARPIRLRSNSNAVPATYYLDRGVPQGSILGPLLFNVAMLTVARELETSTSARYTIYADDITIWTEAQDYGGNIEHMTTELQAALIALEDTLPKLGLTLAPEKTQLLCVNGRRSVLLPQQAIVLTLGQHELRATHGHVKILGIPIHSCNTGQFWTTELKKQWPRLLHTIKRVSNKFGGARQAACTTLIRSIALGKITYGSTVVTPSKTAEKNIQVLYRQILRTITGLPKFTNIRKLQDLTPLPSIDDIIKHAQTSLNNRLHLTTQGQDTLLWDTRRVRVEPRNTAAEETTLAFPTLYPSKMSTPLATGATTARQRLSHRHNQCDANAIFTDAALDGDRMALAWYKPSTGEARRYICTLNYATPAQAELLAIWTALQDNAAPSTIYTDSFEALKDIEDPSVEDITAIRIRHILQHKQKNGIDVRVAWTPGHVGAQGGGNEVAHGLATSQSGVLPFRLQPLLHGSPDLGDHPYADLPPNSHFEMARIRRFLKYANRERLKHLTPPHMFKDLALSRSQEIFINKILANTATTPDRIHKWQTVADQKKGIDASAPPICTFCHSVCEANLQHLILHCPMLNMYRDDSNIFQHCHIEALQNDILENPDHLVKLAHFGVASGLARAI